MSCFLLIHGNRHGAWAWDRVVPLLRELGHEVHAIDLPGHGLDETARHDLTLDSYKYAVVSYVAARHLDKLVLVVHSAGGAVAAAAAKALQANIEAVVFIAALIPRKGECLMDYIPFERRPSYFEIAAARRDRSVPISFEQSRLRYFEELSEEEARLLFEKLTPEPIGAMTSKITDDTLERLAVPKLCVICRHDVSLPLSTVRGCAEAVGATILEVDSGHNAMLSHPAEIVQILASVAH